MMFRRMVDQVLDLVEFGNVDLECSFFVASGKEARGRFSKSAACSGDADDLSLDTLCRDALPF